MALPGWLKSARPDWVLGFALALAAVRLVPAFACPVSGKVDPDVGHYCRGAKHWALTGTFARDDDFATEFVTPVHAWVTAVTFRAFGASYENAIRLGQVEMSLALCILAWGVRRLPFGAAAACLLFFWGDFAVSYCWRSGGTEPTQMLGIAASVLLVASASSRPWIWAASGFFFAWAVFAKPTAVILGPAFAAWIWWDTEGTENNERARRKAGGPEALRRGLWFCVGALPLALVAGAFLLSYGEMAGRAWQATMHQAGDHDRSPWTAVGVALFHWGNLGWRHTLAPLFHLGVLATAPALFARRSEDPDRERIRWFGWLAVGGFACLLFFPPTARRYVLIALPLAYLAGRALAEPAFWEEALAWFETPRGRAFAWIWALCCMMPVFSYLKEPLSLYWRQEAGRDSAWAQSRSGFALLAGSGALLGLVVAAGGRVIRASPAARALLAGSGALLANLFLVRLAGLASKVLGPVRHTPNLFEAPPDLESVERAALVAAASCILGILIVGLVWRWLVRGQCPGYPPSPPPLPPLGGEGFWGRCTWDSLSLLWRERVGVRVGSAGTFFAALAALFAVGGLFVPIWRDLRTADAGSDLPRMESELAARVPAGSVVYGGRYADAALLSVPCRVVTPWAWYGSDVDAFLSSTAKHRWNLPIARFRPDFLLLEDWEEDPNVRKVWGPWLEGLDRGAGPVWEGTLDKHRLRLYALCLEKE